MSYEGYEQFLCKNGHEIHRDAYAFKPEACPYCGEPFVWVFGVNQTNGVNYKTREGLPHKLSILEPAKICKCKECGNSHQVAPPRYKIPTKVGHKLPIE